MLPIRRHTTCGSPGRFCGPYSQANAERTTAAKQTAQAAGLRAEAELRAGLSPQRQAAESTARTAAAQKAAERLAAQRARQTEISRRYEEQRAPRYEPPNHGRSGPSIGR